MQRYGDQGTRLGAGVAVVAIHAGLGLALLTAFSGGVVTQIIRNTLTAHEWTPPPLQPQPVKPNPKVPPHTDQIVQPQPNPIAIPQTGGLTLGPLMPMAPIPGNDRGVLGDLPVPPRPHFAPVMARPLGNPGEWVSTDDYPSRALREGWSGVTRLHLVIGTDGRVAACSVTASSGHPELDTVACAKVTDRAHFAPAKDETGATRDGTYDGAIHWQIVETP